MSHTPGPWTIHNPARAPKDERDDRAIVADVDGMPRRVIAEVFAHVGDETWAPSEANARLIAAAPELLAALKRLLAELSEIQVEGVREACGNTNAAVLRLRIDEARAAIRKAEGG